MTTAQPLVGHDFGIYRVTQHEASIDIVDVYQAVDTLYERSVQLRILRSEFGQDRTFVQQFVSAGRSAMRLRHDHIVAVLDAGQIEGHAYITVESIQAESLASFVQRVRGPLPEEAALRIVGQLASGLQYAHREGFVHGRLNPDVIRVVPDERVLIGDFELEHIWSNHSVNNHTIWRQIVNPSFLAPEQAGGVETIGPEVDLFSLGTIAYWLVTGQLPFTGANALAIMRQIADAAPLPPRSVQPAVSIDTERTILHALRKNPEDRIGSAGEFLAGLAGSDTQSTPKLARDVPIIPAQTPDLDRDLRTWPMSGHVPVLAAASNSGVEHIGKVETSTNRTRPWYADRSAAGIAVFVVGVALVLLVLVSLLQSASILMERIVEGGRTDTRAALVVLPTVTPTPGAANSPSAGMNSRSSVQSTTSSDTESRPEQESEQFTVDNLTKSLADAAATAEHISTRALRAVRMEGGDAFGVDQGEPVVDRREMSAEEREESGRTGVLPVAKLVTTPTRTRIPTHTPTAVPSATLSPTHQPTATFSPTPSSTATAVPASSALVTVENAGAGQAESTSNFTDPAAGEGSALTAPAEESLSAQRPDFHGRIAFTLWNPHTDRPDIYIWYLDTRVRSVAIANRRQPDFGPTGNLVANAEGGGYDNIVMMGRYGEDPWVISEHPEDAHPHWSRDGKLVVFDSAHMGDRQHRIYLKDDLGTRAELPPIMYDAWEIFGRYPIFLHDDRVAFHGCNYWETGSICGIHVVDIQGGKPTTATGWPGDIPTDNLGDEIVFMSDRKGNWDIYRMAADGSNLRQLTDLPSTEGLATVSPDGTHIAYLSNQSGEWAVYAMNAAGGESYELFALDGHFGRGEYDWLQERLSWGR